ncbi:MAG: prephenate dehydrogenase/arogenate dehydrogenase family protein, partial [Gemmatimonadota bacterium]
MSTVAILGLGLIGGSLASALAASGRRVIGYDRSAETARLALQAGVITSVIGDDLAGLEDAATVVLAVPVGDAAALLKRAAPRLAQAELITDVGSTKRSICAA